MADLSTQTTQMSKKVIEIKSVLSTYGTKLSEKFEAWMLQTLAEATTQPDGTITKESTDASIFTQQEVMHLLSTFAQAIEILYERLEASDEKVFKEQSDDQEAILKREQTLNTTRTNFIALKNSLEGSYGATVLADLGLTGDTPDNPTELYRLLKAAAHVLEQKNIALVPRNPFFPSWSVDALKTCLQDLWQPLESSIEVARLEARETQDAQIERRSASVALNQAIVSFNGIFESIARLVGETEVANRLRPGGGRPRKSQDDADTSTDTNTDPNTTPTDTNTDPNTTPNNTPPTK